MSAPEQLPFLVLAEREFTFGTASNAAGKLDVTSMKFLAGKDFEDTRDDLKQALATPSGPVLVNATIPFAAVQLKPENLASKDALMQVLKSSANFDEADMRVSLAEGERGPVALCSSKAAIAEKIAAVSSLGLQDFKLFCNGMGTVSALQAAMASGQIDKPVLVVAVLKAATRLSVVSAEGVTSIGSVDTGTDAILEEVMGALGLKFPGSAAKLFYGDLYDFDEHASRLVAPLCEKLTGLLSSFKAKAPVPAYLYASGLPSSRTVLLGGKIAEAAGLARLDSPIAIEGAASSGMPSYFGAAALGTAFMLQNAGQGARLINLNEPEADIETLLSKAPKPAAPAAKPVEPKAEAPAPKPVEAAPKAPEPKAAEPEAPKTAPAAAKAPEAPAAKAPEAPASKTQPAEAKQWKRGANKKGPPQQQAPAKPVSRPEAPAPRPEAPAPAASAPAAPAKGKSKTGIIVAAIVVVALIAAGAAVMLGGGGEEPAPDTDTNPVVTDGGSSDEESPVVTDGEAAPEDTSVADQETETQPADTAEAPDGESVAVEQPEETPEAVEETPPPPPAPTTGNVSIRTTPVDAEIYIDGEIKGLSPLIVYDLPIGSYTVEVRKAGYRSVTRSCDVEGGETTSVDSITLQLDTGKLDISSSPSGVSYTITPESDGAGAVDESVLSGTTPVDVSGLKPGTYKVTFSREGWKDYSRKVEIGAGKTSSATFEYKPGKVSIVTMPRGAQVSNSRGESLGTTPLELDDLPEGTFTANISMNGFEPETLSAQIPFGGEVSRSYKLLPLNRLITRASELDTLPSHGNGNEIRIPERVLAGFSGTIYTRFVISIDGRVEDANVVNDGTIPQSVVDYVTSTVRSWSFTPGSRKGFPMRVEVVLPIQVVRQ